ncbi:PAS domain-containing protein [uncultured Hymenobacter sp.]|uniref:PAS domain-containing sensor histidine kinase n=1 Tax=uncultured Hymenobacter sp. TaxID=170016 RepID=UPI0035CA0A14
MAPSSSAPAPFTAPDDDLLPALLAISLSGVIIFRPVWGSPDPATITDLAYVQLNPAAQRMLQLPERPAQTFLTLYPNATEAGIFAFYRDTFLAGTPGRYDVNYQHDGLDNYFHLAAQRCGDVLVVSFNDTGDQPRTPVEEALRQSQAAEQAARADAEAQRQRFYEVLMQLPAQVAVYHGPDYVFNFVNSRYQTNFSGLPLLGRALHEVLPVAGEQGILALLDRVYQTGEPFYGHEREVQLPSSPPDNGKRRFINAVYHPLRDAQGRIDGVLDFSYDVTEQVRARRQVEQLNQELETRVQERTAQLQRQQGLLRQILGQVPAFIATLQGPAHQHTYFNAGYHALSGNRAQVGLPVAEVYPETIAQGFVGLLDEVYRSGQPFTGTEMLVELYDAALGRPAPRYLDFIYQPLTNEQHQTTGIMVFAVDVTDKVLARQQAGTLQAELLAAAQRQGQQREAFYQVFEQTPALIALLRAPGHRFEYVNPAYQRLFPGRQLVGLDMVDALPEVEEQGFVALLDRVYQTGETYFGTDTAFEVPPAAGQPARMAYYNFTYQAYQENGQVAGISIFAYGVTEQVRARQERETERQQLAQVFSQAPVAICVFRGPDYVLDVVNPLMGEMLGRPLAELVGRPFFEALPELTSQGLPALLEGVRQTGIPFVAQEQQIRLARHGAGEAGYFTFTYQPLRDAAGRVAAITCVAVEVTGQVEARQRVQDLNEELAAINEELQATNEELSDANQQLTRTNVDLDNFIYTASHDLKAPITNIEGLLDALRQHLPPAARQVEPVPQLLAMMQGAVERFQLTITQLTDITRLQQAQTQPAEAVDLAALVEAVRLDLDPALRGAAADVRVEVSARPYISFAPKNLRSIVYNLLSNAVKYRHPARPAIVELRAYPATDVGGRAGVVLEVQDNGLGLDGAQQAKLFGMFQRLHTHVEGSGIGLYMVKKIVDNASGTITVESEPGVGSTFRVFLPETGLAAPQPASAVK